MFDQLRSEVPKFRHKIVAMNGDCSFPGLGLTLTDRQTLISNVNIVFHAAATVRFDEKLKLAIGINVHGIRDVLDICKQMTRLKVSESFFGLRNESGTRNVQKISIAVYFTSAIVILWDFSYAYRIE